MALGLFVVFFGALALGWGLGLLLAIIVLARKPRVPEGCLFTGGFQLLAVGLTFPLEQLFFDRAFDAHFKIFAVGSIVLGTMTMLGPAVLVRRHDRRRRPNAYAART